MGTDAKTNEASLNCVKLLHVIVLVIMIVRFCVLIVRKCISIALVVIGGYLIGSFRANDFTSNNKYIIVPIIVLCLGFATILVCLLGIYGRKADNICMLKLVNQITFILTLPS